jgi:Lon protease-like protein
MGRKEENLDSLPVFPLPRVVLFPEALLPLHIFEPRYRAMLDDCLASGGKLVIAKLNRDEGDIASIASVGEIVEHEPLPDGRSNIVVAGLSRVKLDEVVGEVPPRFPYKRVRATRLSPLEVNVSDAECSALFAAASMFVAEVRKHDPSFTFRIHSTRADGAIVDAGALADLCAFELVVDAKTRQAILEELDPRVRVRMVMDQLAVQHSAMIGETKGAVLN